MARLDPLTPAEMTDTQRRVHDESLQAPGGARDRAPRPFTAWLRSPELARRAFGLGEFVRRDTTLAPRLVQIAALTVARHWSAQYLWHTRKQDALKLGLAAAAIDAIANRQTPALADPAERAVHAFSTALQNNHQVPDAIYRQAVAALGEAGVAELVGVIGYYTLVAMTLTSFELGLPEGAPPELAP
ncbi:MAG TPA: carboxymuconolactone decarboxylase family protein [Alphaproteobacteria bacterium]